MKKHLVLPPLLLSLFIPLSIALAAQADAVGEPDATTDATTDADATDVPAQGRQDLQKLLSVEANRKPAVMGRVWVEDPSAGEGLIYYDYADQKAEAQNAPDEATVGRSVTR